MTVLEERFTLSEWRDMVSDPTKDDRHYRTPLGPTIAAYVNWKANEAGAADSTVHNYERYLAHLAVQTGLGFQDLTIDHLRTVRDSHKEKSRHGATAAYKDFCKWLYIEGYTQENIAGRMRYPKQQRPAITGLFSEDEKAAIVAATTTIRDRVCVLLLLQTGIRKGELRNLQVRDVDLRERLILVRRGKGSKARRVPIRGAIVRALDEYLMFDPVLERTPEPDDYLLYPSRKANQHSTGVGPNPKKAMAQSTAHTWWYKRLQDAEIVDLYVNSGRKMHSARHTYATDLGRATNWNMLAVSKNLGHSGIAITVDTYTQFAFSDQERAVEMLPDIDA